MATATSISLKNLVSSTGPAVEAALKRHPAKTGGGLIIDPGTLAGPLLDVSTDIKVAQQIAEDVTKAMQQKLAAAPGAVASTPLSSGVLITRERILCGFFPYPGPVIRFE